MKYTEEEVIDIIRSYNSNLTAEESLEQWNIKKSNTEIILAQYLSFQ